MVEENYKTLSRKEFVGELFQELGFSVHTIGSYVVPNPLFRMDKLLRSDEETLRLSAYLPEVFPYRRYVNSLDFILTHPNGSVQYLKVSDQDSVVIPNDRFDIFDAYPEAIVLSMASYWSDTVLKDTVFSDDADPTLIDQIRDSFFQVHCQERTLQDRPTISTCSLQEWLTNEYGMMRDRLIERYIAMVISWPLVTPRFLRR